MNINKTISASALTLCLILAGCANIITVPSVENGKDSDATIKKKVAINHFSKIKASQAIKIIFTQGDTGGNAHVATTPEAEKYLVVEVKGETLKAYYKNPEGNDDNWKIHKIKGPSIITVSAPVLNDVELSSAASLTIDGKLRQDSPIEIDCSSSASLEIENLEVASASIETSSAAGVGIGKFTGILKIEASSGGNIRIGKVKSQAICAEASSGGNVTLAGIDANEVRAQASSGAGITLKGKALRVRTDQSSGGNVNAKHLSK